MVEGNIIQLQSEAMAFCFKHLNLSGVVRGLYREEELEVPAEALREAIINALAHRLYTSGGAVSLAIYEDRVEISNPGNFSPDASRGVFPGMASTPRNPMIAKVLYLRKAIEMWGRGIGLILDACEKAHLAAPKIYEDRGFVYTVFREDANGTNGLDDDELLIENVRKEPNLSLEELSNRLNVSRRTVARMVDHLKAQGRLRRVGVHEAIGRLNGNLLREIVRRSPGMPQDVRGDIMTQNSFLRVLVSMLIMRRRRRWLTGGHCVDLVLSCELFRRGVRGGGVCKMRVRGMGEGVV